jgi:ArsR family transcriptional regulator
LVVLVGVQVRERALTREWARGVATGERRRIGDERAAGHIRGAISIPLRELKRRVADVPADREVVAYCRGPYCVMAVEAVALLRAKGFDAHRMEQGVVEWRARGWRVVAGKRAVRS